MAGVENGGWWYRYQSRTNGNVKSPDEVLTKHSKIVKKLKPFPTLILREIAKLPGDKDIGYNPSPNTVKKIKSLLDII